ncbi:hypothetical protein CVT26_010692 [Gymnopilus dilepis]|uniref:C2H2-type domain-containing protein n=1 Tax=Gymnopilus dilepis TaxID=231916 RepID=A0A409VI71_9AGAR|nr:hypothetical protein CVT26_010692 [Gymnopilus dilepis]
MSSSYPFPSQASSVHTYPCKWHWCRETFPDNPQLVQHVILEHVNKAPPVKREDIPHVRRAEDGTGDSIHVPPYILYKQPPSRLSASPQKVLGLSSQDVRPRPSAEPSSSLPSPPFSSPMLKSQAHILSKNLNSPRHRSSVQPPDIFPAADTQDLSKHAGTSTPPFRAIGSPAGSHTSVHIPTSPHFSALVHQGPAKRAATLTIDTSSPAKKPNTAQHHHFSSQSSLNHRPSIGERAAVEEQLTQLDEEDSDSGRSSSASGSGSGNDSEEDSERDAVGDDVTDDDSDDSPEENSMEVDSSSMNTSQAQVPPSSEIQDGYTSELSYALSQPQNSQLASQTLQMEVLQMEAASETPSQLQQSSFPYHIHGPKKHVHVHSSQPSEPDSSLILGPPALLSNPQTFAVSTPVAKQQQIWYQPQALTRTASGSGSNVNSPRVGQGRPVAVATPAKSAHPAGQPQSQQRNVRTVQKAKKFTSGTLQIVPAASQVRAAAAAASTATPKRAVAEVASHSHEPQSQTPSQLQSQSQSQSQSLSYMDSSQSQPYQDSLLLQTQAPYHSQPMTQSF